MASRRYERVQVTLDFRRPASIDGTMAQAEPLETAREILRGVHSGMVALRRMTPVAWDCPSANFGLLGLTDQLAAGLALLEEIGR